VRGDEKQKQEIVIIFLVLVLVLVLVFVFAFDCSHNLWLGASCVLNLKIVTFFSYD
jgi:hypothetical protein